LVAGALRTAGLVATRLRGVEGVVKMNSFENSFSIMAQQRINNDEIRIESTK